MTTTAGDYLCERLIEWGVDTIYGFPGDGINGILGLLVARRQASFHPDPSRGDGFIHGLRARQIHW